MKIIAILVKSHKEISNTIKEYQQKGKSKSHVNFFKHHMTLL